MKKISIKHKISLIIFGLFLCIVLLEIGLRFFYFINNKSNTNIRTFSEDIGWENEAYCHFKQIVEGYGEVEYTSTKYGFRVFGDVNSNKTKIFIVGDSFTEAPMVSDGNTYYDYLKENNDNIEIFAYGCSGYGSLQEYMIVDRYFDVIKPDIILWQFCRNDFSDSDHEIESLARDDNIRLRPYYKNGRIEYLYPLKARRWQYKLIKSSYLLYILHARLNIRKWKMGRLVKDENPPSLSEAHPIFKRSIATISEIMGLLNKRVGNIPIVAFSADYSDTEIFSNIFVKHDIRFIQEVFEAIKEAREAGIKVDGFPYDDSHWNDIGHSIVGREILDYLIEKHLL